MNCQLKSTKRTLIFRLPPVEGKHVRMSKFNRNTLSLHMKRKMHGLKYLPALWRPDACCRSLSQSALNIVVRWQVTWLATWTFDFCTQPIINSLQLMFLLIRVLMLACISITFYITLRFFLLHITELLHVYSLLPHLVYFIFKFLFNKKRPTDFMFHNVAIAV